MKEDALRSALRAQDDNADRKPVFLYLHVMKTGGTSMLRHLADNFPRGALEPDVRRRLLGVAEEPQRPYASIDRLRTLSPDRRDEIQLYAGHLPFAVVEILRPDVTFTVLREPVARTISMLQHFRRYEPERSEQPLEEIYDDPMQFPLLLHNYQSKLFSLTWDDDPPDKAHLCVIDVDQRRLNTAKQNLATLDLFGLQERYEDFLDDLRQRFGWQFPNHHRQRMAPEVAEVSGSLRRRIAADNAADIDFYDHAVSLYREHHRHPSRFLPS